jgi:hypothetical protein
MSMPILTDSDILYNATQEIIQVLQAPTKNSNLAHLTPTEFASLQELVTILHKKQSNPNLLAPKLPPTQAVKDQVLPKNDVNVKAVSPNSPKVQRVVTFNPAVPTEDLINEAPIPPSQRVMDAVEATSVPQTEPDTEYWGYHGILDHRPAPKGSGSSHQVLVNWEHHEPTYVNVNVFSDNGQNAQNCEQLADYAKAKNLLNAKGWKQFRSFLHSSPPLQHHSNFSMTKKCINFFEEALHVHTLNKAVHPDSGKLVEYPALLRSSDGEKWEESTCEEIGRLAQGYPPTVPNGTNTMFFIRFDQMPSGRKATYLRLVVADRATKENPRRVRFTLGGDKINYPGDC